jgi:hypothetical protein
VVVIPETFISHSKSHYLQVAKCLDLDMLRSASRSFVQTDAYLTYLPTALVTATRPDTYETHEYLKCNYIIDLSHNYVRKATPYIYDNNHTSTT